MILIKIPPEQQLEYELYLALKKYPDRCQSRWRRPTTENPSERELISRCAGCIAIEKYETLHPERVPIP